MYTQQPFSTGCAGYRNFYCFVPELCPWPSIPSRLHFGGEGNQWKSGEAPTQLDHSNQSSGIINEESRLRLYQQNVKRILRDLCLYSIISLLDRPQSPGAWNWGASGCHLNIRLPIRMLYYVAVKDCEDRALLIEQQPILAMSTVSFWLEKHNVSETVLSASSGGRTMRTRWNTFHETGTGLRHVVFL